MKSNQSLKSSSNSKSKKSKDREKRKSQIATTDSNNHSEDGSPIKDSSNFRQYAGINSDCLNIYAEQSAFEFLKDDVSNLLCEDINYKLRYIIHNALIKGKLSGSNGVSSQNIDETFEELSIDKIYGAPTNPIWAPLPNHNLLYLEDSVVNVVEIAESERVFEQCGETVITRRWLPDKEPSEALKNYFTTMCQTLVSNDDELRKFALLNISENSRIGPIIEWFYNFSYFLLAKVISYDCLTLYALDLVTTLENSELCKVNVSEKKLKLLVRLILQRLLKSVTTSEVLKPMCRVLTILCRRPPLKDFVFLKMSQKIPEIRDTFALQIVTTLNSLGINAVVKFFLPNMNFFLEKIEQEKNLQLTGSVMETFNMITDHNLIDFSLYSDFYNVYSDSLLIYMKPFNFEGNNEESQEEDLNFIQVKMKLLKNRRKITCIRNINKTPIEKTFDVVPKIDLLKRGKIVIGKISSICENIKPVNNPPEMEIKTDEDFTWKGTNYNKENRVTVGKTSLLLPVLKSKYKKSQSKSWDYSFRWYNL